MQPGLLEMLAKDQIRELNRKNERTHVQHEAKSNRKQQAGFLQKIRKLAE